MRVLVQAGHHPNAGGAPGEAQWTYQLAGLLRARLLAAGIECAVVGDWFNKRSPPETATTWDLFVALHYDAAVYATRPGGNTGAFAGRAANDPAGAESDRALWYWNTTYFAGLAARAGYAMRRSDDRSNPNVTDYYGFRATTAATPGILIEHGVGAPTGSGSFPAGRDAALLHDRIDLVADLDAEAIIGYLGLPPGRGVRWAPLAGVRDEDPTDGGFRYLERTPEGVFHPGIDLNAGDTAQADCGDPVAARYRGVVRYVGYHVTSTGRGFGWHVWGEADGGAGWPHHCHLQQRPEVVVGQRVAPETVIGLCGRTAGWPYCHSHLGVYREAPPGRDWGFWPVDRSREQVAALTHDPAAWFYRQNAYAVQPLPGDEAGGEELAMDTTPEERAGMQDYFQLLGIPVNPETALMKRAALAKKRDEGRGPAITGEYQTVNRDGKVVVRQKFSGGALDYHQDTGETFWAEPLLYPEDAR